MFPRSTSHRVTDKSQAVIYYQVKEADNALTSASATSENEEFSEC